MEKLFPIETAKQLLVNYKKKRHFAKAKFINELIELQYFFGNTTILNCELLMNGLYRKQTIMTVLNDMDYTDIKIRTVIDYRYFMNIFAKKLTVVKFS